MVGVELTVGVGAVVRVVVTVGIEVTITVGVVVIVVVMVGHGLMVGVLPKNTSRLRVMAWVRVGSMLRVETTIWMGLGL